MAEIKLSLDDIDQETGQEEREDPGVAAALEKRTAGKPALAPALNETTDPAKEPERQLNVGQLPISVHDIIDDAAYEHRTNRKTLILRGLKGLGVAIPDDLLRDRRSRKPG